jgi:glycerol-3-phosphate dehydrogenase
VTLLGQGRLTSVRASSGDLAAREFDLLVIGGGITGAGVLRDAAMRGLTAVLVDRGDFAAGTSSRSSRLIHGGLRYLEYHRWGLVFESLRERDILLRIAPHLVRPLAFVLPVYAGDRVPRWRLAAGLTLYGLLAAGGNVPRPRMFGKAGVLAMEPNLRMRGLRGGGLYHDAQCDDARLVLATIRSAMAHGALAANYAEVTGLVLANGQVAGATVRDRLTGEEVTIRSRAVVNATGAWSDRIRRMEDPACRPALRLTRGAHVVVPRARLGHTHGITFSSPVDGRVMFVLPWSDLSYIGTTDTDHDGPLDLVEASPEEVRYLLRSANALFPMAHVGAEDVIATWAGLRSLPGTNPHAPASSVTREHLLLESGGGMLTIAGGKLTTYRRMAADVVNRLAPRLGRSRGEAGTDTEPLPGGESPVREPFIRAAQQLGLAEGATERLLRLYGTESAAICNRVLENHHLGAPIHPTHLAIGAEVVHAVRRELAQRVEDVLDRRLHLTTETADHGHAAAAGVASLMGQELGWDAARIRAEAARFLAPD